MEKYNLFLDDIRDPKDCCHYMKPVQLYWYTDFIIVRNYDAFVKLITERYNNGSFPELVSFDHDLADEHYAPENVWHKYDEWAEEKGFKEKTGYDCAKWLVDFCMENKLPLPNYIVHSMNVTGAKNITSYLENYKKHVLQQ